MTRYNMLQYGSILDSQPYSMKKYQNYGIVPTLFSPPHVPWCDIYKNISKNGQKVQQISENGLCLVEVIRIAIDKYLGIKNSYNAQARKIWAKIKTEYCFTKILHQGKAQHLF